jgi:hypothetical protein
LGVGAMEDDLTRAERYGTMATSILRTAEVTVDQGRCIELLQLSDRYTLLAHNLIERHAARAFT